MTQCHENQLALEAEDKLVVKEKSIREVILDLVKLSGPQHDRLCDYYPDKEVYTVTMKAKKPVTVMRPDYRLLMETARCRYNKLLEDKLGREGRDLYLGMYSAYNEFACYLSEEEVEKIRGDEEVVSVRPMDVLTQYSSDEESESDSEQQAWYDDESDSDQQQQGSDEVVSDDSS